MNVSLEVLNKTYYHSPRTRCMNTISKPSSWMGLKSRQNALYQRLFFEHRYCSSKGGLTLFYTLTYSEKRITKFFNHNVHDYNHISWLMRSSGFVKVLARRFNCTIKYCITSEFGEGKGKRGYNNNPHYHAIFFLYPIVDGAPIISAEEFRALIRSYWQGLVSSVPRLPNGQISYTERINPSNIDFCKDTMTFGLCTEGNNLGIVSSDGWRALSYVAKYVGKDMIKYKVESFIYSDIEKHVFADRQTLLDTFELHNDNFYNFPEFGKLFIQAYRESYVRTYEDNYKPRFLCSQGLGYSVFDDELFDKESGLVSMPFSYRGGVIVKRMPLRGQLSRIRYCRVEKVEQFAQRKKYVVRNGRKVFCGYEGVKFKQSYYRPNEESVRIKLLNFDSMMASMDAKFSDFVVKIASLTDFNEFKFAYLHSPAYLRSRQTKKLILDYGVLHQSLESYRVAHEQSASFTPFASYFGVYRGRRYDADYVCPLHPRSDYERFLREECEVSRQQEDYQKYQTKFHLLSEQNFRDYESHKDFKDFIPLFDTIEAFTDYFSFKVQEGWRVESEFRARKRRFAQGLSDVDPTVEVVSI